MGLLKFNPLVEDAKGLLGDMVLADHKPGIKVIRRRPIRDEQPTPGELINRSKFGDAIAWAKGVWAQQPGLKAKYVQAGLLQHRRGFSIATGDFLRPPSVEEFDLVGYTGKAGELIRIRVADAFGVAAVGVRIKDLAGAVLEEGAAVQESSSWVYAAQREVPAGQTVVIEGTAHDHPGHSASKQVDHACGPRV